MTKTTKHKKARVADFAKAKLKLGKGKQVASNATNTSIAAKSIALPSQTLSIQKDEPVSRRNHTLPDLLIQTRHYSTPVKKEALAEILQLLTSHPFLLPLHLLSLISHISHLISDAVPTIRTSSISLLKFIFDTLPNSTLQGCSRGLILFTVSALSSLDEGIRIDALKVLDLLLDRIPGEIVRGWEGGAGEERTEGEGSLMDIGVGGKVVEALLGVLRVRSAGLAVGQGGFTSAASADLSPSSRLAVLTTLSTFLRCALSPSTSTSSTTPTPKAPWYLSHSFTTPRSYLSFLSTLPSSSSSSPPLTHSWSTCVPLSSFSLALSPLSTPYDLSLLSLPSSSLLTSTTTTTATHSAPSLLTLLHPTLLSSFLDSAPTAFAPTLGATTQGTESHLKTIVAAMAIARELFWKELDLDWDGEKEREKEGEREKSRSLLAALLNRVEDWFPMGSEEGVVRNGEAQIQLLNLNLICSSLVSLLVLSSPSASSLRQQIRSEIKSTGSSKAKKTKVKARKMVEMSLKIESMLGDVCEWVVSALLGEITTASQPLGMSLTTEAYEALEPTLWSLLNQPPSSSVETQGLEASERVWEAVLNHFGKSSGECKKRSFGFISRVVLMQEDPAYCDRFQIREVEIGSPTAKWLISLPKYLWELNTRSSETTEMVLSFLARIVQQGEKGLFPISVLSSLLLPLVPFFHLQHPTRGPLQGPFVKLPTGTQNKVVDLVSYLVLIAGEGKEEQRKLVESVERALEIVWGEVAVRWGERRT